MSVLLTDFEEVMTTTRAVRRRLDFDRPVPRQILEECLEIALQAPTGGNAQDWRFVMIDDKSLKNEIGSIYRDCFDRYVAAPLSADGFEADIAKGRLASRNENTEQMLRDAAYLAKNVHRAPWLVLACASRPNPSDGVSHGTVAAVYGSVFPAVWSFNLALRSRGLGTVFTSLTLHEEQAVAKILGIPEGVTQCCLLPVAFTIGVNFNKANRRPLNEVAFWNGWDRG